MFDLTVEVQRNQLVLWFWDGSHNARVRAPDWPTVLNLIAVLQPRRFTVEV